MSIMTLTLENDVMPESFWITDQSCVRWTYDSFGCVQIILTDHMLSKMAKILDNVLFPMWSYEI